MQTKQQHMFVLWTRFGW